MATNTDYVSLRRLVEYHKTMVLPAIGESAPDTKNTAGATDSSSKLFLIGATSQATNPQTYSHDTAYVGTDGHLYSNSSQVVNLKDTQTISGAKIFTSYATPIKIQNGNPAGAFLLGADVWGTVLTAGTRKLGRMGVPAFNSDGNTNNTVIAGISFDSQEKVNYADFGGHPSNSSSAAPDVIRFVVSESHNNVNNAARLMAFEVSNQTNLTDAAGNWKSTKGAKFYLPLIATAGISGDLTGTADKAMKDSDGNKITDTYATLTNLNAVEAKIPSVPSWALNSSKPSYNYSEIVGTPSIPTKTSDLTNDSDFITSSAVDTKIDDAVKGLLGDGVDAAYDTFKEIQTLMEADDEQTANLITAVNANTSGISSLSSSKLGKTTYEWNNEKTFGGSGKLCIGSFPMYDSGVTVTIKAVAGTTYYGVLVLRTQNVKANATGSYTATVYGDASNTIAPNIHIERLSGTNVFTIYFNPQTYSKNLIHIQAVSLNTNTSYGTVAPPTNICTLVDTIPTTATIKPNNALTDNFQPKGNYLTSFTESDPTVPSWAKASTKPSYSYSEITDKPTIPSKTSQLTNDSGFLTTDGGTLNDDKTLKFSTYGTRFVTISGNSITADMSNVTGGWAGAFAAVTHKDASAETGKSTTTMLGWYGSGTGLTHIFMGGTYSDPFLKFTPNGIFTFKNRPKVGTTNVALSTDIPSLKTLTVKMSDGTTVGTYTPTTAATLTIPVIGGEKGEKGEKGDKGDKGDTGATGPAGTNGANGVSVTGATAGTTSQSNGYTVTPVTFSLSNGTTKVVNVQAKNGTNGTNGTNGKDGEDGTAIFINGTGSTAGTWLGSSDEITEYYTGLTILYRPAVAGASTTTLDINGLGAKRCYRNNADTLTTHYPAGSVIFFVYDETLNSNAGGWRAIADYDSTDVQSIRPYYALFYTGANPLYAYKICGEDAQGRIQPLTITSGTGTSKTVNTVAIKPDKFYWYSGSATVAANSVVSHGTLYMARGTSGANYTFNSNITTYKEIYLKGTYDATTGLFTLDNSTATSWYVQVPYNTTYTASSYFTSEYQYIFLGRSYSSNNYMYMYSTHQMYSFDGTNLLPQDLISNNSENNGGNVIEITEYTTTSSGYTAVLTEEQANSINTSTVIKFNLGFGAFVILNYVVYYKELGHTFTGNTDVAVENASGRLWTAMVNGTSVSISNKLVPSVNSNNSWTGTNSFTNSITTGGISMSTDKDIVWGGLLTLKGSTSGMTGAATLTLPKKTGTLATLDDIPTSNGVNLTAVTSNVVPNSTLAYSLGTDSKRWNNVYATNVYGTPRTDTITTIKTISGTTIPYTLTLPSKSGTLATQEWVTENVGGSSGASGVRQKIAVDTLTKTQIANPETSGGTAWYSYDVSSYLQNFGDVIEFMPRMSAQGGSFRVRYHYTTTSNPAECMWETSMLNSPGASKVRLEAQNGSLFVYYYDYINSTWLQAYGANMSVFIELPAHASDFIFYTAA